MGELHAITTRIEEEQRQYLMFSEVLAGTNTSATSRVENFMDANPRLAAIMEAGVRPLVELIFEEPATLMKEKINLKYPGHAAYGAHQDIVGGNWFNCGLRHLTV